MEPGDLGGFLFLRSGLKFLQRLGLLLQEPSCQRPELGDSTSFLKDSHNWSLVTGPLKFPMETSCPRVNVEPSRPRESTFDFRDCGFWVLALGPTVSLDFAGGYRL